MQVIPQIILWYDNETKEEVIEWMLDIQLGRRNLSPIQRTAIAEKYRPIYEKHAKERQATSTGGANPQLIQNLLQFQLQIISRNNS